MADFIEAEPLRRDPTYAVTILRTPLRPAVRLPQGWFHNVQGPVFGQIKVQPIDSDLTAHGAGEPIGARILIFGRVTDSDGRPVRNSLIEIWQANSAGGYIDSLDVSGFPLDPNFRGAGRCLTDDDGNYSFLSIKPGAYPAFYAPGYQAWRAAHVHFSIFGPGFDSRLVTQMYFEGDPLLAQDRFVVGIPDARGRDALVAKLDAARSISNSFGPPRLVATPDGAGTLVQPPKRSDPGALRANPSALAYRFDIVLRGRGATPFEDKA